MSRIRSEVREQVRQRAEYRCEYCRKPENFGAHNYQVDHIIAQKHRGTDELDNLAWACFRCNLNKGSDIASYDLTDGALVPFYNPRTQQWQDHFHLEGVFITGKTAIGRVSVEILQFNHPVQVEIRRMLLETGLWG